MNAVVIMLKSEEWVSSRSTYP